MALGDVYQQLEDKWYELLDSLDSRGVHVYSLIDPIEKAGVPSFPLAVGVLIILLGLGYYFVSGAPGLAPAFTVKVIDLNDKPVAGAAITVLQDEKTIKEATTDKDGVAKLEGLPSGELKIVAEKATCPQPAAESFDPSKKNEITLQLQCKPVEVAGCSSLSEDKLLTVLSDDQNNIPSGCVMRVYNSAGDLVQTPFKISPDGTLDISASGTCPAAGDRVQIDCDQHKYEATVDQMYRDLDLFGRLTLKAKDETPSTGPGAKAELTRDVFVKVVGSGGAALSGIQVKAVSETGEDLLLGFDNIVLEAATDVEGNARLRLPDQQPFSLATSDPSGAYQPFTGKQKYVASLTQSQQTITITLSSGFATNIFVREKTRQTPIADATVTVSQAGKTIASGKTDSQGKITVVLLKGASYDVAVFHPLYFSGADTVLGGETKAILLDTIDITKTGRIIVDVVNAHGIQGPFRDVRLQLWSEGGNATLWTECITPSDGRCVFDNVKEGTYHLEALAPGETARQAFPNFIVSTGNTSYHKLFVNPAQVVLTVLTQVDIGGTPIRKQDVNVQLWDADFQERIAEQKSGTTRKVDFTLDRGQKVFVIGTYVDPATQEQFGPEETTPSVLLSSRTVTLTLGKITESVDVSIEQAGVPAVELVPGQAYTARVSLSLPFFQASETYKSASVELFVGEPGKITDLIRTPIVIDPVSLSDFNNQDPFVSAVTKADEFEFGTKPTPEDTGTSKYVKVDVGSYSKPVTFTISLPVYVRELARGNAKVQFKATWLTKGGQKVESNQGQFRAKAWPIKPAASALRFVETGDFSAYNAFLSDAPTSGPVGGDLSVSQNALFYLQFTGKARSDAAQWTLPIDQLPDNAQFVSYSGSINRTTGQSVTVPSTPLSGFDANIRVTEPALALGKDDTVSLTVVLKALNRGKGSLTVLKDFAAPLGYSVVEPARTGPTIVSGVNAILTTSSNFCVRGYDNGLGNLDRCYFNVPQNRTLPANDKRFRVKLQFEGAARTVNVALEAADANLKFANGQNFIQQAVPSPGAVVFEGLGSAQANNLLSVFIWDPVNERPVQPWATLTYGPVDYEMKVTPFTKGVVTPAFSELTTSIEAKLFEKGAAVQAVGAGFATDNKVSIAGQAAFLDLSGPEPVFRLSIKDTSPLQMETTLVASVDSPRFGKIKQEFPVVGLAFEPSYPHLLFQKPINLGDAASETVKVRSTWPEPLVMKLPAIKRDGFSLSRTVRTFSGNTEQKTYSGAGVLDNIEIPASGRAEITITAQPVDARCRLDDPTSLMDVEIKDKLSQPARYSLGMRCLLPPGIQPSVSAIAPYTAREAIPPSAVDGDSCTVDQAKATYAYLCDAEQLSLAILKASDDLLDNPLAVSDVRFFGFGKDSASVALADASRKKFKDRFKVVDNVLARDDEALAAATNDVVFSANVSCGVVKATMTKINADTDVKAVLENVLQADVKWCDRSKDSGYGLALLNFDEQTRPDLGKYYAFDAGGVSDAKNFVNGIIRAEQKGSNLDASLMFSYNARGLSAETIVNSRLGTGAAVFVKVRDCESTARGNCPGFAGNAFDRLKQPAIGYFHITDRDDVQLGLIYDKAAVPEEKLNDYRTAFAQSLLSYLTKGPSFVSGWEPIVANNKLVYKPLQDRFAGQLVDLRGPEIDSMRLYGIDQFGTQNEFLVGSREVTVEIRLKKPADFCAVSNVDPSGAEIDTKNYTTEDDGTRLAVADWQLTAGSGRKSVNAFCVAKGIASHKVRKSITLDVTPMQLLTPLPDQVTTDQPVTLVPPQTKLKVRDRFADVKFCELELVEPGQAAPEIHDDDKDGVFDPTKDTVDDNRNGDVNNKGPNGVGIIPGTTNPPVEGHMDGACIVTPLPADPFFKNAEVTCYSPFIEKTNENTEVKLTCRDAVGNKETLGSTKVWRWSAEKPKFDVPESFVMSTDMPIAPAESKFWFNKYDVSGLSGAIRFGENFELSLTSRDDSSRTGMFDFKFTAADDDGISPSGAGVQIDYYEDSYDGRISKDSLIATYKRTCVGEATVGGSLREVRFTCQLQLARDKLNNISISVVDGNQQSRTEVFRIAWDEVGPVYEPGTFRMQTLGEASIETGERNLKPQMSFKVLDHQSEITACNVEITGRTDTLDSSQWYNCNLADETTISGQTFAGKYKIATCSPAEDLNLEALYINLGRGKVKIHCTDKVDNLRVSEVGDAGTTLKAPSIDQLANDIVEMCRIVRYGAETKDLKGFKDLSESDDGVRPLIDQAGGLQEFDPDGITYTMFYTGSDISRGALADAVGARTLGFGIPRSPECSTQGVCDIAIVGASIVTGGQAYLQAKTAAAGAQNAARVTIRQAIREGLKAGIIKSLKIGVKQGIYVKFKALLTKLIAAGILREVSATVSEEIIETAIQNQVITDDPGFDCHESPGFQPATELANTVPFGAFFNLGIPDDFQALVCSGSGIHASKTQVISVKAAKLDMSAGGSLGEVLSVCLQACDDFVCQVTINEMQ